MQPNAVWILRYGQLIEPDGAMIVSQLDQSLLDTGDLPFPSELQLDFLLSISSAMAKIMQLSVEIPNSIGNDNGLARLDWDIDGLHFEMGFGVVGIAALTPGKAAGAYFIDKAMRRGRTIY